MPYDAYIFDLDGTLLDTLPDLVRLTNAVLEEQGFPLHTSEEVNSYVGGGARLLLKRAAPEGASEEVVDQLLARWKELYLDMGHSLTHPYPKMPETLAELKRHGAKLAVLSNKFDAATRSVIAAHFPGVFDCVRGESAEIPRKPDPTGLKWMMNRLGVTPEKTAYIGDSGVDMKVANNAQTFALGVTWGYREADELLACGASRLVSSPEEILSV